MIKCHNCGCQNLKGAKECVNCRNILLPLGITFKPAIFTRQQKFSITLVGIAFLMFGIYLSYNSISDVIPTFSTVDLVSIIRCLMYIILSIGPGFMCYLIVFILHFSIKHGKDAEDISNKKL